MFILITTALELQAEPSARLPCPRRSWLEQHILWCLLQAKTLCQYLVITVVSKEANHTHNLGLNAVTTQTAALAARWAEVAVYLGQFGDMEDVDEIKKM